MNKCINSFRKALQKARQQNKNTNDNKNQASSVQEHKEKPIVKLMLEAVEKRVPGADSPGCGHPLDKEKAGFVVAAVITMQPKLSEDLAKIPGVVSHQKWLTKRIEQVH